MDVWSYVKDGRLQVLVKPNAPKTSIVEWDESRGALRVFVAAVPNKDKANKELVKFFSKLLKKKVEIIRGSRGREKVLLIR